MKKISFICFRMALQKSLCFPDVEGDVLQILNVMDNVATVKHRPGMLLILYDIH